MISILCENQHTESSLISDILKSSLLVDTIRRQPFRHTYAQENSSVSLGHCSAQVLAWLDSKDDIKLGFNHFV